MSPAGRRGILIGGVVVMVGIVVAAVVILTGSNPGPAASEAIPPMEPDPTTAAQHYLQALSSGDTYGASELTDDQSNSYAVLRAAWQALRPDAYQGTLGKVGPAAGNKASAAYTAAWTIRGGKVWTYDDSFGLVKVGENWRVHWTPAVLHPKLQAGQQLALVTAAPDHPAVVDADGRPLVIAGPSGTRPADPNAFAIVRTAIVGQVTSTASDVLAVERVDASGHDLQTLYGDPGDHTKARKSTLSLAVQAAAQSAVNGYDGKAVIMALRPSDGGLLAVAENARAGDTSPFSGLYAPGSTFKIVTATATLEAGIATQDSLLPCPLTEHIGTRTLSNEGFDLGTTTMHRAFARSCNTTFGKLASQLPSDALTKAADQYGLNADFKIPGLTTELGAVVPPTDADQQVEDGIGQGNVQVSPFGELLMAATVAVGHAVTPRLWADAATGVQAGYTAPPAGVLAPLRTMMREVVTGGTGTGLAGSGLVYGKTGTAQVAGAKAHGWFTGYRGDMAFVVFLEDADDSHPAVAVGAQFLAALK